MLSLLLSFFIKNERVPLKSKSHSEPEFLGFCFSKQNKSFRDATQYMWINPRYQCGINGIFFGVEVRNVMCNRKPPLDHTMLKISWQGHHVDWFSNFLSSLFLEGMNCRIYNESYNEEIGITHVINHKMVSSTYCSKWQAFKLATLSGLAEPLGVIIVGMSTAFCCIDAKAGCISFWKNINLKFEWKPYF